MLHIESNFHAVSMLFFPAFVSGYVIDHSVIPNFYRNVRQMLRWRQRTQICWRSVRFDLHKSIKELKEIYVFEEDFDHYTDSFLRIKVLRMIHWKRASYFKEFIQMVILDSIIIGSYGITVFINQLLLQ